LTDIIVTPRHNKITRITLFSWSLNMRTLRKLYSSFGQIDR